MRVITEPMRQTEVIRDTDVVIVGGGPAGLTAALAARRLGVEVLVIEQHGCLGGLMTSGFVTKPQAPVIGGIPEEIFDRAQTLGGARGNIRYRLKDGSYTYFMSPIDPEIMKRVVFEKLEEARVDLLLHSLAVGCIHEKKEVKGIIIESKSGRQAVFAQLIVDTTGDADVASWAGAPYRIGRPQDHVPQPMTMMFKMSDVDLNQIADYASTNLDDFTFTYFPETEGLISDDQQQLNMIFEGFQKLQARAFESEGYISPRNGFNIKTGLGAGNVFINATRISSGAALDVHDLTQAEVNVRKQVTTFVAFLKQYVPGFQDAYLSATPIEIGVRETRRIIGDYTITLSDILSRSQFHDVIAKGYGVIDIHEPGGRELRFDSIEEYQIPFRCLLPQTVDNMVVAGRCISCDHESLGTIRTIPTCMYTGQAAGVAAALAVRRGNRLRNLDITIVQDALIKQKAVIHETLLDRLKLAN
ncbi:MAG: FAD-dependent oxidoreductase [Candidatus Bathyarchaeota archaeon]|nr:FAD-dependent oxidoreductase [Candidatus Bathyarchaeota archaeon]